MSLIENPHAVLSGIPNDLRDALLEALNEIVRNYREMRWEPSELNGGKLCEIVYSILKGHVDGAWPSAPYKPRNMFDDCMAFQKAGKTFPRSVRIQIPRALITLYEIRNNRNVGHVGADVDPNHMDATLVLSISKWIVAELVRIFHQTTTEIATEIVDALTDRTIPLLWKVGEITRVLRTDLSAKDKMLVVLYGARGSTSVKNVVESIEYGNASRFRSSVLTNAHKEGLIHFDRKTDTIQLSPVGVRYVESNINLTL